MEFRRESFQMDHPAARGQESRAMEGEEKWASAAFVPRAKLRRACPSEARVSLPEGLEKPAKKSILTGNPAGYNTTASAFPGIPAPPSLPKNKSRTPHLRRI